MSKYGGPGYSMAEENKGKLKRMQECLDEAGELCTTLQTRITSAEKPEIQEMSNALEKSNKRIHELEDENNCLKIKIQLMEEVRYSESFQIEVDQLLMKLTNETRKLEEKNKQLMDKVSSLESEIVVYKDQLMIYKEDFDKERSDRENAQGKIADLQKQLANNATVNRHELELTSPHNAIVYSPTSQHNHCLTHPQGIREYTHTPHHPHGIRDYLPLSIRSRGFDVCDADEQVTDGVRKEISNKSNISLKEDEETVTCDGGFDTCDIYSASAGSSIAAAAPEASGGRQSVWKAKEELISRGISQFQTDGVQIANRSNSLAANRIDGNVISSNSHYQTLLRCPKCDKSFTQKDHMLLLEHLEVCN